MGKIKDLFKKIRDIKGLFHTRLDMIKDRNCKDLTEGEEIKKRWPEYRRRQWRPTPVLLLGKSHGRRSLVGCSPWGR